MATGVLIVLVAGVGFGQEAPSLEQLVREAMARDTALEQRQLELRNSQLTLAQRAAGKGFSLALGLGGPGDAGDDLATLGTNVGDFKGITFGYGARGRLIAQLPHPFGSISTTVGINGETSVLVPDEKEMSEEGKSDQDEWKLFDHLDVDLSSRIEQPMAPLFGLDATDADDLEATHGVMQAQRGVRQRVRAITGDILDRMITMLQRRIAQERGMYEVSVLAEEVDRRREVFQDNEKSHSFQTLLFNLDKARRALETTQFMLEQDRVAFAQRTGATDFGSLDEVALWLPQAEDVERVPDVVDAAVDLRVSEHRIREDRNTGWPTVTIGASYDWETFKLSAGIGFNLTLPLFDGGRKRLEIERLTNGRAAAELAGTAARREFADALIQAERNIRDLEYRTWELREQTRLAALKVEETKAALAAGVITPDQLVQAELDHALLALDGEILRAERWQLKLDLDALTDADPLDFSAAQ